VLPIALGGPVRAATDADVDVRARPPSTVVGDEWGHVSSLRDAGCNELGDGLKRTWALDVDLLR
jgi:hypothetical protein